MPRLSAVAAMAIVVTLSNVLVQFPVAGGWLTWGAFTYPLAFLVTDVTNRLDGPGAARRVVLWGFAVGLACSLVGSQVQMEFGPAVPLRIAVASGAAFLVAQMLDVGLFHRLRRGSWWRAPLVSSTVSSMVDTGLFFALAFSATAGALYGEGANAAVAWALEPAPLLGRGPVAPYWASLAVADFAVKLGLALVALVPFRLIVGQRRAAGPLAPN